MNEVTYSQQYIARCSDCDGIRQDIIVNINDSDFNTSTAYIRCRGCGKKIPYRPEIIKNEDVSYTVTLHLLEEKEN